MTGPLRLGRGLGLGYCEFDGYVLALTTPGKPRMPNGLECDLDVPAGAPVWIGGGRLQAAGRSVLPGPDWEPVPVPRYLVRLDATFEQDLETLAGRGAGLTPAGDDVLAGYAAALTLYQGRGDEARQLAERAGGRTTSLSATLLQHAACGELPEPAHHLLERGDPEPLRSFGHSSGRCLMLGLALGCSEC